MDIYFKIRIFGIEIKRKGSLVKRKSKFLIKNNQTDKEKVKRKNKKKFIKEINFNDMKEILKYIEIEKLDIKILIGVIFLFPTVLLVPMISMLLENIKKLPLKKFKNFKYEVMPAYDNLKLDIRMDSKIKIRIFDIIKIVFILIRIYREKVKNT